MTELVAAIEGELSLPRQSSHRRRHCIHGFTLVELLVVIAIIGVLVALLLPAIQSARESARRTSCINNLRQVGLAVMNYADRNKSLPAGYEIRILDDKSQGNKGIVVNGFFTLILPYAEESVLEDLYDYGQGYDHLVNQPAVNTPVAIYQCPSTPGPRKMDIVNNFSIFGARQGRTGEATDYFGIRALHDSTGKRVKGVFRAIFPPQMGGEPEGPLRHAQITDGLSKTILLIEMAGRPERYVLGSPLGKQDYYAGTWAGVNGEMLYSIDPKVTTSPANGDCFINCNSFYNPYSFHPGGVNMMLCDGSVHFLRNEVAFTTWWALAQPTDGATVDAL